MKQRPGYAHICKLLESYLDGQVDGWTLESEFNRAFHLGADARDLTPKEREILSPLSSLIARFSDIESDLIAYPRAFVEGHELRVHVAHAREALKRIRNTDAT